MEALILKYGFNGEQINDIKGVIAESLTDLVPHLIDELMPAAIVTYKNKMKADAERMEESDRKSG